MTHRTKIERLKGIQNKLKVEPDGELGPVTLTALEKALSVTSPGPVVAKSGKQLRLSKKGVALIIGHEIGSKAYYNKFLKSPAWPGGDSGVTIGVGYDLGYKTADQFNQDWGQYLPAQSLKELSQACGKKGRRAKAVIDDFKQVTVSLNMASAVFTNTSLPRYSAMALKAFPGIEDLEADAQAALLSLVYNRGTKMAGDSRREMKEIQQLVPSRNYQGIAAAITSMKRLWQGKGLDGLLKRRDEEAELVLHARHPYTEQDLV